jgi:hypothetical protein
MGLARSAVAGDEAMRTFASPLAFSTFLFELAVIDHAANTALEKAAVTPQGRGFVVERTITVCTFIS